MTDKTILKGQINCAGKPFTFFFPGHSHTHQGTISCLKNDKFHLRDITFAPGDVFVDLGCNVGLVSMSVAALFPHVRVYGFDASSFAIHCFKQGIIENRLLNVSAYNFAIGDHNQDGVRFLSNGEDAGCLVEEGFQQGTPEYEQSVPKISVEEIFDSKILDINRVRYLKIDIEGGENKVLTHLLNKRPDLLSRVDYFHLELHPYQYEGSETLKARVVERFGSRVFFDT